MRRDLSLRHACKLEPSVTRAGSGRRQAQSARLRRPAAQGAALPSSVRGAGTSHSGD